jgi:hypothetical protein
LATGVYKDDIDFGVFSGEWLIGRIFEQKGFALEVLVFWSLRGVVLTRPPGINADGHAATLHAAKAEFAARSRHRTCGKVATL